MTEHRRLTQQCGLAEVPLDEGQRRADEARQWWALLREPPRPGAHRPSPPPGRHELPRRVPRMVTPGGRAGPPPSPELLLRVIHGLEDI